MARPGFHAISLPCWVDILYEIVHLIFKNKNEFGGWSNDSYAYTHMYTCIHIYTDTYIYMQLGFSSELVGKYLEDVFSNHIGAPHTSMIH